MAGAPDDPGAYLLASDFPKGCVQCELERCPYFNCVASLTPERVWAALRAWGIRPPERAGRRAAGS